MVLSALQRSLCTPVCSIQMVRCLFLLSPTLPLFSGKYIKRYRDKDRDRETDKEGNIVGERGYNERGEATEESLKQKKKTKRSSINIKSEDDKVLSLISH